MGQFTLVTYLRPFLEAVTHVGVSTLSLLLLIIGVAGFVGTILIGPFLKENLYPDIDHHPGIDGNVSLWL